MRSFCRNKQSFCAARMNETAMKLLATFEIQVRKKAKKGHPEMVLI